MRRFPVLLLPVLLTLVVATPAFNRPTTAAQLDPAIRDRVTAAAIQVGVTVSWTEGGEESLFSMPVGSGTIVSADGLVLTNYHVVEPNSLDELIASWQRQIVQESPDVTLQRVGTDFILLGSDGGSPPRRQYFAALIAEDQDRDIAVLRIEQHADNERFREPLTTPTPFVEFGNSDDIFLGDRVQIFAYPAIGGDSLTYTAGVISGFGFDDATGDREWISTDAVMSGGSSGGTAINDAGLLIGIPTGGSSLDCREGDTNRDGVIDEQDVGCIPTGGSLGQLIPINDAIDLLERNGIILAPGTEADASQPDPTPAPTTVRARPTPIPTATATPLPTATATSIPTRTPVAASRACAFAFEETFDDPSLVRPFDEGYRSGFVGNGAFNLAVNDPGSTLRFDYDQCGTGESDASFYIMVQSTSGQGEILLSIMAEDGSEWLFAVEPWAEKWALYRKNADTGLFYWIEPISYSEQVDWTVGSIGVIATEHSTRFLINGRTIADSSEGLVPRMTGSLIFGFGIGINPYSPSGRGQTFEAAIDRVILSELR